MNKFNQIYPKSNVLLTYFYAISMLIILLDLSLYSILISLLIDTAAFLILTPLDQYIFYKLFPEFKPFKNEALESWQENEFSNREKLFLLLIQFPEKRSFFCFCISLFKVLPAGIFIASQTQLSSSFFQNLAAFYLGDIFILIFSCGLLYTQLHQTCSDHLRSLQSLPSWQNSYYLLRPKNVNDRLSFIQNFVLSFMLINLLGFAYFINNHTDLKHNYSIMVLFATAILCIGSIQYQFQKFFRDSLKSMFNYLEQDFATGEIKTLPLHTSPILAGFESTINQLGHNLQAREHEIQEWLRYESEQFHMRSLGEITALVAHDIKNPLHVMRMSLDMMNDPSVDQETKDKYNKILEKNLSQTITFTQSLMAYLRGQDNDQSCLFFEVHNHLIDLFETQYPSADFKSIDFKISDLAQSIELKISRLDAMHIFYNIYHNAIKSVLARKNEVRPEILITASLQDQLAQIIVQDNGLGMNPEKFEKLTSFNRFEKGQDLKKGLGLRITKILVNHLKGNLVTEESEIGARLRVSLPVATEVRAQHSTALNQELAQTLS